MRMQSSRVIDGTSAHHPRRVQRERVKQALELSAKKVEQAKVDLGKSYMTLIMGMGNVHCHHSLQGR